jgi:hypothetical protein
MQAKRHYINHPAKKQHVQSLQENGIVSFSQNLWKTVGKGSFEQA